MSIYVPQPTEAERKKFEDDKTVAVFQYLMKRAYTMDRDREQMRYALIKALAKDMLGRDVDFEVFT